MSSRILTFDVTVGVVAASVAVAVAVAVAAAVAVSMDGAKVLPGVFIFWLALS